jgi:hypothetical protein
MDVDDWASSSAVLGNAGVLLPYREIYNPIHDFAST